MSKKWPPRPAQDFKITSVQWQNEIEATHRRAGFPEVKYAVIQRRFWQFLSFLGQRGYLINAMPASLDHVNSKTELLNSDLNDDGYAFVQRFEGKWVDRLHKDKGEEAEWKFLENWHTQFLCERANASSSKEAGQARF
jgi:hypothetical protein